MLDNLTRKRIKTFVIHFISNAGVTSEDECMIYMLESSDSQIHTYKFFVVVVFQERMVRTFIFTTKTIKHEIE